MSSDFSFKQHYSFSLESNINELVESLQHPLDQETKTLLLAIKPTLTAIFPQIAQPLQKLCDGTKISSSPIDTTRAFSTRKLLEHILISSHSGHNDDQRRILHKLRKRFEIKGRIFSRYRNLLRSGIEPYDNCYIYALLSLNLLIDFIQNNDYQSLSTSLLLNDLICNLPRNTEEQLLKLLTSALSIESLKKIKTTNPSIRRTSFKKRIFKKRNPKTLEHFSIILLDSLRSRAYIQKLLANQLIPDSIFVFEKQLKPTKPMHSASEYSQGNHQVVMNAKQMRKYFLYSQTPSSICPPIEKIPKQYLSFEPTKSVYTTLDDASLEYRVLKGKNLNEAHIIQEIKNLDAEYVIFCGRRYIKERNSFTWKKIHPRTPRATSRNQRKYGH